MNIHLFCTGGLRREVFIAVIGILIGDVSHQSKKLSNEIIDATFRFLKINYSIKKIILGVNLKNFYAIKALRGLDLNLQNFFTIEKK